MAKKKLTAWHKRQDPVKWFIIGCVILAALAIAIPVFATECEDHNWDVWKVAKALERGMSKTALYDHLNHSAHELTPERMAKISSMIEDAYLLEGSEARGWYEKNFVRCAEL
jgi:hypothetical protein